MSVVDDYAAFSRNLFDIISDVKDTSEFDYEHWFQTRVKSILGVNNQNYLMTLLFLKKCSKSTNSISARLILLKIIESIHHLSMEKKNEDTKFLSETARFADADEVASNDLQNAVMNIVSSGSPTGGDIVKLSRCYRSENPPSIEYLRSPDVIEPIMMSAFSPGHPQAQMTEKIYLLAYSAFSSSSPNSKADVKRGVTQLTELSSLLERTTSMVQLQVYFSGVLKLLKEPLFSTIILAWIKIKLFNDDFYDWTSLTMSIPCAFHILDEIAVLHPTHRSRVLDVWISLFEREFDFKDMDPRVVHQVTIQYREKFMDHFVLLFMNHYEKHVISYLALKVDVIDPSLMIHFLNKVIPNLELQMDIHFYQLMLQMLKNAPAVSLAASPPVQRLLAVGHHLDLEGGASELHLKLEGLAP